MLLTILSKVLYNVFIMINTVSITDLKQNTAGIIKKVQEGKSVVILQRSQVAAVLVDPKYFEALEQSLEDAIDLKAIEERKNEPTVSFDEYFIKRFGKNAKPHAE